jgi:membrane protein
VPGASPKGNAVAFVGPITLLRRVTARLNSIGWTRAAGGLAFATLLGLVPVATVAFAFVAQFPLFQEFLDVLERFLLRYMLPETASSLVHEYVVGLATEASSLQGVGIVFVLVTAALVVGTLESEINAIWGIRQKRPLMRRVVLYLVSITAGPVMIGATITFLMWVLRESIAAVPLQKSIVAAILEPLPFLFAIAAFTVLYALAPARKVAWSHALLSGALAAFAFEVSKRVFAWYVHNVPTYQMLYGALAAFPVFLLWVFCFWLIVLAGAAFTAALAEGSGRRT